VSWTASATAVALDEVDAKLKEALDKQLDAQPFDSWDDDVEAQQVQALEAVKALAGEVRGAKVNASINGHRVPPGQTGSDTIGVSVSSGEYVKGTSDHG
jgi:hypothetical protein